MAGYIDVSAAIKVAEKLLKDKSEIMRNIDTVRSDLRNAVDRKETDAEQTKWIGEQFPVAQRERKTAEEKAKVLRQQAKEIEDRAKQTPVAA